MDYLRERREALGGSLPARRRTSEALEVPDLSAFDGQLEGYRRPRNLHDDGVRPHPEHAARDKKIGKRVVPIVPDEARTFGMEGMFRQFGIYSRSASSTQPEDADQLMFYKEDKNGQMLQEGINEPGAMSAWIAAATAYSTTTSR